MLEDQLASGTQTFWHKIADLCVKFHADFVLTWTFELLGLLLSAFELLLKQGFNRIDGPKCTYISFSDLVRKVVKCNFILSWTSLNLLSYQVWKNTFFVLDRLKTSRLCTIKFWIVRLKSSWWLALELAPECALCRASYGWEHSFWIEFWSQCHIFHSLTPFFMYYLRVIISLEFHTNASWWFHWWYAS